MKAELFYTAANELGEGPLWVNDRLYWFDILAHQLHCLLPDQSLKSWNFDEPHSAAGRLHGDDLLLASASGLWRFSPQTNDKELLIDLEKNQADTRSNDGRADRLGGFWISTMGRQAQHGKGALYRFYQGELNEVLSPLTIPNSICFAPDNSCVYFSDCEQQKIFSWSLDKDGWPIGDFKVFVDLTGTDKYPDGSVVDEQGYLWNAQWGGSRVVRYSPNGEIDELVELPVTQPSCPAFGGKHLDRLYITSAREGLSADAIKAQPMAGSIFEVVLDIPGLVEPVVSLSG